MKIVRSKRFYYSLAGFSLGVFFPLILYLISLIRIDDNAVDSLITGTNILLVEIAVMPFLLGFAGYLIGRGQDKLIGITTRMRRFINDQERMVTQEHFYFNALVQNSPLAVVQLDSDHRVVSLNPKFQDLFGYSEEEIIGKNLDQILTQGEYFEEAQSISQKVVAGDFVHKITKRFSKEGAAIDVEVFGIPVIVGGEKIGAIGLYLDITKQKDAEKELIFSESRFKNLFENSPISLWEEDFSGVRELLDQVYFETADELDDYLRSNPDFVGELIRAVRIIDVNKATLELYSAESKEGLFTGLETVLSENSPDIFIDEVVALASGNNSFSSEIEQIDMNGDLFHAVLFLNLVPGYEDSWERLVISILDITANKNLEYRLRHMSFHDSLTGLYNRAYFDQELTRLNKSRLYPMVIAVCDIDNLKSINDTFGHGVGDLAIQTAGQILQQCARVEDMVARIGGDEFGMIFPKTARKGAKSILNRIINAIERHNSEEADDGLFRPIDLSIGIEVVWENMSMYDGLKAADQKMYSFKNERKLREPLSNVLYRDQD
jgi:diguanylate cyclase (GGDEF)-like protein/PAS domain S-box-containing protein